MENPTIVWANGLIKGKKEEQYNVLKKVMKTKAGIVVVLSLAATLVSRLGLPNFIVNVFSDKPHGKTLSGEFAVSLLGSPSLGVTWNATPKGLEQYASTLPDMPLFIDSLGLTQDKWSIVSDFLNKFSTVEGKRAGMKGIVITTTTTNIKEIEGWFPRSRKLTTTTANRIIEIDLDEVAPDLSFFTTLDGEALDGMLIHGAAINHHGHFGIDWKRYIGTNAHAIMESYRSMLHHNQNLLHAGKDTSKLVAAAGVVIFGLEHLGIVDSAEMSWLGAEITEILQPNTKCPLA